VSAAAMRLTRSTAEALAGVYPARHPLFSGEAAAAIGEAGPADQARTKIAENAGRCADDVRTQILAADALAILGDTGASSWSPASHVAGNSSAGSVARLISRATGPPYRQSFFPAERAVVQPSGRLIPPPGSAPPGRRCYLPGSAIPPREVFGGAGRR
jgi:hypothetical protein